MSNLNDYQKELAIEVAKKINEAVKIIDSVDNNTSMVHGMDFHYQVLNKCRDTLFSLSDEYYITAKK